MDQKAAGMNGFILKMIAVVTMLIDHIGAVLYPGDMIWRYIGRIAFPIFVFLLTEGFAHTKDAKKYGMRLFVFALISEIPFDLAIHGTVLEFSGQNVFFTLWIGLLMLMILEHFRGKIPLQVLTAVLCMLAAYLLRTDYDYKGILLILVFWLFRGQPVRRLIGFAAVVLLLFEPIEYFALLAYIPILLYNGKRGLPLKYLFYIFYPAHLSCLYFLLVSGRIF